MAMLFVWLILSVTGLASLRAVEAPAGIEPARKGFADLCLTVLATEPHFIHSLSPLPRVDFSGRVGVRTSGHLDNLQPLAAVADHYASFAVARIDQARQGHVQLVDRWLVQGVDIHAGRFSVADRPEAVKTFPALGYFRSVRTGERRFISNRGSRA